jgi:kumamolisin
MTETRQRLAGSEREPVLGARRLGACDPTEEIWVVVCLRRQAKRELDAHVKWTACGGASEPLSREAFAERFGAATGDIAQIEAFARRKQLSIERVDAPACTVVLSGSIEHFQQAFGVDLSLYEHPELGRFRGRAGALYLPDELDGIVTAVLGLDDRAQARTHFRLHAQDDTPTLAHDLAAAFTPVQIASLYNFPDGDGSGQCIGIIELGGGYHPSDLRAYFHALGVPQPNVVSVPVEGSRNTPSGNAGGADSEVTLDLEIAGAIAPKATIAAFFAPNSDAGFIDAFTQALHDTAYRPSVISISWGAPESTWTDQAIAAFNDALQCAVALGVTVCVAAGDSGSSDGMADGADHVNFPASSPYVLACGGTRIAASAASSKSSSILREVVWNDGAAGGATGGGLSARFAAPPWQEGLRVTRVDGSSTRLANRGVPDVAADASPDSGYQVLVDGRVMTAGGTSAVAPLMAGLIARINAKAGKPAGFVNAALYKSSGAFNDVTQGKNGSYAATRGWDACTGLGSPNGARIAVALKMPASYR